MAPQQRTYYETPEDALKNGFGKLAIGDSPLERMVIVFPRQGQNYVAFRGSPGVPIRKATTSEIDRCRRWKAV